MKVRWIPIMGAMLALGLNTAPAQETAAKPVYIDVVVHGGLENPFWKIEEQGVKDISARLPDAVVSYRGPRRYNFPEFMTILQDTIDEHPDALVCTLTEPVLMDDLLRPALADGLPVIAINAADMRPADQRMPVKTYIGEDSYQVGVLAADELVKLIDPKRAIFGNHHNGAANIEARGKGFCDTLKEHGVPADVVDISIDPVTALERIQSYRTKHPEVNVIFLNNEVFARSLLAQLEGEGIVVGKDMYIIMMDTSPLILQYVADGKFLFAIDQQAYLQSYLGVLLAYLEVREGVQPPTGTLKTGPVVVGRDDAKAQLMEKAPLGHDLRLALITDDSRNDPSGVALRYGVRHAAHLLGDISVKVWSVQGASQDAMSKQIKNALAAEPDALICALSDMDALEPLLADITIPVLRVGGDLAPADADILTSIGDDRQAEGTRAAQEAMRRAKPRRALFVGASDDAALSGWNDVMKADNVDISVVKAEGDSEAVAQQVVALYDKQPDVDVALIANPEWCSPIVDALEAKGYHVGESVRIAQLGVNIPVLNNIMDGKVMFALRSQPYLQGFLSVVFAAQKVNNGFNPPKKITAGTILVDETNMSRYIK